MAYDTVQDTVQEGVCDVCLEFYSGTGCEEGRRRSVRGWSRQTREGEDSEEDR